MQVIQDNLWLCIDCLQAAVNDDYTGLDYSYSEPEASAEMKSDTRWFGSIRTESVPDFDGETSEGIDEFSAVGL